MSLLAGALVQRADPVGWPVGHEGLAVHDRDWHGPEPAAVLAVHAVVAHRPDVTCRDLHREADLAATERQRGQAVRVGLVQGPAVHDDLAALEVDRLATDRDAALD